MSERVSSQYAKTLSQISSKSLLYTGEDVINLAFDLLDSRARVKELERFVVALWGEFGLGGDIDGGWLQDEMEKRGLIVPHVVTADEATKESDWGEGDTIYDLAPELGALRGDAAEREGK